MQKIILIIIICMFGFGGFYNGELSDGRNAAGGAFYEGAGMGYFIAEENDIAGETVEDEMSVEVIQQTDKMIDAQLLVKYPDTYGWMESRDYGDIPYLANAAYIDKSVKDGIFLVSTPEELASFNYYVNTTQDAVQYMQLQNDIDLTGYEWAPMGWSGDTRDFPFSGSVDGNGYTICNMTIDCDDRSVGFIGWETYCGVWNLTLENAYVKGKSDVGVLTGQAIRGWYENCHVTGEVYGEDSGSLHGYSATNDIIGCTADVTVNGEPFVFLTWNDKARSEIEIENPIEVVLNDDYSVTYTPGENFTNLGWQVKKDGRIVVERDGPELTYSYEDQSPGTYKIYLTAFVEGQYVPVSNIVEYTIE